MNITPNKLSIAQLFATVNEQFIVPSYQRRYAWGFNQHLALFEDIDMLKENDGHLFGMIIIHTSYHTGGLNQPELVDGQQRMTTLVILLKAIRDLFAEIGKPEKVSEIDNMLKCKGLDDIRKSKIKLGELDNPDIENLLISNDTKDMTNDNIAYAYQNFKKWLGEYEFEELNRFYFKLTNIAVIIRLDVGMAQDAYKLFETINNRGLKLTPTDIIKNFLLGHAAKIDTDQTLEKVKGLWSQIIINLNDLDTDDFLRHFICATLQRKVSFSNLIYEFKKYYLKNIKKAELLGEYSYYENELFEESEEDDEEVENSEEGETQQTDTKISLVTFLTKLKALSLTYKKISKNHFEDIKINRRVENLNKILSKPTYIFLMHFLQHEGYGVKEKIKVLKYLEGLMLRRHICESRTNENDDIFSRMVSFLDNGDDLLSNIKAFIEESEYMPDNDDFCESLPKYEFKGKLIDRAKYMLASIEYFKRGNTNELIVSSSGEVEIEHIIPQTINTKKSKNEFGDWETYLGNNAFAKHKKHVNLIGNMTLLGESLNIIATNNPFKRKKASYKKSSFRITAELDDYTDFKFNSVVKRGELFAELAVKIWPQS